MFRMLRCLANKTSLPETLGRIIFFLLNCCDAKLSDAKVGQMLLDAILQCGAKDFGAFQAICDHYLAWMEVSKCDHKSSINLSHSRSL